MCVFQRKTLDLEEVRLHKVFNVRQRIGFYLADSGMYWVVWGHVCDRGVSMSKRMDKLGQSYLESYIS